MLSAGSRLSKLTFWLALLAVMAAATTPVAVPLPATANDKVQHMLAFALLAFLALRAYPVAGWLRVLAGLALYGALIEIVQMIPALHRMSEWRDWAADLAGVAIALIIRGLVAARRLARPLSSKSPRL